MDWIKANYEKIILGVIAAGLLASAVMLFLNSKAFLEVFSHKNATQAKSNVIPPLPMEEITQGMANIKSPVVWSAHDGFLFISRPYVLRDAKLIDLLEGEDMVHPPISNEWLVKYNLDYSDPNLPNTDPDHDGFTVLEEWLAKTDPTDPKSIPPYYTKLRLKQYLAIPFRLKFNGTPDDGQTFTINTIDKKGPTQFLKLGEMIDGTPFKLLSYKAKNIVKDDIPIDESEVLLENTENKEKVTLVKDKVVDSPTSKAKFLYLLDNSEFEVKKDDTFSLPSEKAIQYKLIEVDDHHAKIQNVENGETHDILPLKPH